MQYEKTPLNKRSNKDVKRITNDQLKDFSTLTMLWTIIKRHKLGLITTYAIVISVLYFVPFAPALALSAIGK